MSLPPGVLLAARLEIEACVWQHAQPRYADGQAPTVAKPEIL